MPFSHTYIDQVPFIEVVLIFTEEGAQVVALPSLVQVEVETCVVIQRLGAVLRQRHRVVRLVSTGDSRGLGLRLHNLSCLWGSCALDDLANFTCIVSCQCLLC